MAVRRAVQTLARRLARTDGWGWHQASGRTAELLEMATRPFPIAEASRQDFEGRLSPSDLDPVLTDEEIDELIRALVAIVDRPERTPTEGPIPRGPAFHTHRRAAPRGAAAVLDRSARLWVLPHPSAALRRSWAIDPDARRRWHGRW